MHKQLPMKNSHIYMGQCSGQNIVYTWKSSWFDLLYLLTDLSQNSQNECDQHDIGTEEENSACMQTNQMHTHSLAN